MLISSYCSLLCEAKIGQKEGAAPETSLLLLWLLAGYCGVLTVYMEDPNFEGEQSQLYLLLCEKLANVFTQVVVFQVNYKLALQSASNQSNRKEL